MFSFRYLDFLTLSYIDSIMLRVVRLTGSLVALMPQVVNLVGFPDASEDICCRESFFIYNV